MSARRHLGLLPPVRRFGLDVVRDKPLSDDVTAAMVEWAVVCGRGNRRSLRFDDALSAIALWASGSGFAFARSLLCERILLANHRACATRFVELADAALLDGSVEPGDRIALRIDLAEALLVLRPPYSGACDPHLTRAIDLCRSVRADALSSGPEVLRATRMLANALASTTMAPTDVSYLSEALALQLALLAATPEESPDRALCEFWTAHMH